MLHFSYTLQDIINAFSFDNPHIVPMLIAFAIANTIGLLEYFWAVALNIKEHRTPFPAWMHTFFFGHDSTAAVVLLGLAFKTHFWLFFVYGGGMLVWTVLEIINMRTVILYEAEEAFGPGATKKDATIQLVLQALAMLAFVNIMRWLMGDVAMFSWLPMTNFVMAVGPGYILNKRQSRHGSSVFVYIMIVIGTIFNFMPAPIGMFTSALPQVYNQPIWFIIGIPCLIIACYNLYRILKLPPKTKDMGNYKNKPIW